MYRVNNKLRSVHASLRAIQFRFQVDVVPDLCQQATRKLDTSPRQFGLEIVDTSHLQYGYTSHVGVTEVPLKDGILPHLPYPVGVVNSDLGETLRVCPIVPVWTHVTFRKSLCFLCPNRYPFPTGISENTRVYAPGFRTIAAKMLRINPDPKKNARDIFCGRLGYRLGFIRGPLGISLGIYPVAAREIPRDFSGGRSGYRLRFIRGPLGILLSDFCQRALPNRYWFSEKSGQTQPIEHRTRCISQCAQPTIIPLFE